MANENDRPRHSPGRERPILLRRHRVRKQTLILWLCPVFRSLVFRIHVGSGTPATLAAQQATKTIPIVFWLALDPARRGVVASMARPGGNATGFTYGLYTHKMLEVLKETLPRISRVAYPVLAGEIPESQSNPEFSRAAAALGLQVQGIKIVSAGDFEGFYTAVRRAGAEAILIQDSTSFVPRLKEMGAGATNSRLPAIGFAREFAQGGGLLYYGPVSSQHWPRLAAQIDKIFNGAKPGDLPVEQPTSFGLGANMKAAKALGVTIPQAVLLRANERIP